MRNSPAPPAALCLLVAMCALWPTNARAHLCRGVPISAEDPGQRAWAAGDLASGRGWRAMGGEVGLRVDDRHEVWVSGSGGPVNTNGSSTRTWGLRHNMVFPGRVACFTWGASRGFAHLLNAEGSRNNARLSQTTLPASISVGVSPMKEEALWGIGVFAAPTLAASVRRLVLYDRSQEHEPLHDFRLVPSVGFGVASWVGPAFGRIGGSIAPRDPLSVHLAIGVRL